MRAQDALRSTQAVGANLNIGEERLVMVKTVMKRKKRMMKMRDDREVRVSKWRSG